MASWSEYRDPIFGKTNSTELAMDQAFLRLTSKSTKHLYFYSISDDCVRCPFEKWFVLAANRSLVRQTIDTYYKMRWAVFREDQGAVALDLRKAIAIIDYPDVGQFGVYHLRCHDSGCKFKTLRGAVSINSSLLFFAIVVIICVALAWLVSCSFTHFQLSNRAPSDASTNKMATIKCAPVKARLHSVDTFRGIAIVLMIFVHSGAGNYQWILHARWNGLHVADTVMPAFLWIMGVCLPSSVKAQRDRGVPRWEMIWRAFVRSAKLFLIGVCVNTWDWPLVHMIRIMGTLQRIGIAYFAVATLHILMMPQSSFNTSLLRPNRIRRALQDVAALWSQWLVMLALIALHLALTFALPVPGCPRGYLDSDGTICTGGATGYIDRWLLGTTRMGRRPRGDVPKHFEEMGLFGCLLTVVHVFFGVQCGVTLMAFDQCWKARAKRWLVWSSVCALTGGALAGFSRDDGLIPVNWSMWSLSFVLVTVALAFAVFAACHWLVDVRGCWSGGPFRWAGMNSIILFVAHLVLMPIVPFHWNVVESTRTHFMMLLENGWHTAMWILVAWLLYRRNVFVRV